MIKVLFMIHDLGHGGAEKVLVNLVNNLNPKKFDISVIALFGGGVNEQYLKSHINFQTIFPRSIPGNSKLMKLFSPKILHKFCVKENFDIEVSYLEGPSARIISGCQNKNTRLISWIHVQQVDSKIASQAFRSYKEAIQCYKKFNKTVCVSESVRDDFTNIFPQIKNMDVLYNTNETDQICRDSEENVEKGIFKDDEIKLCGVGKIMPIKGFDKLARIHKKLLDDGYPVHTYILGVGPEKEKIQNYVNENKLQNTFTFLGYQTNPYKYIARCDLFVCASTAEGFSTAATEALIVGTPVVTTPVAGMKEMLGQENDYGVISEMSEDSLYKCIRELIDTPETLDYYRRQAVARGKDFSKEKTVMAVEQYLENLFMEEV